MYKLKAEVEKNMYAKVLHSTPTLDLVTLSLRSEETYNFNTCEEKFINVEKGTMLLKYSPNNINGPYIHQKVQAGSCFMVPRGTCIQIVNGGKGLLKVYLINIKEQKRKRGLFF